MALAVMLRRSERRQGECRDCRRRVGVEGDVVGAGGLLKREVRREVEGGEDAETWCRGDDDRATGEQSGGSGGKIEGAGDDGGSSA